MTLPRVGVWRPQWPWPRDCDEMAYGCGVACGRMARRSAPVKGGVRKTVGRPSGGFAIVRRPSGRACGWLSHVVRRQPEREVNGVGRLSFTFSTQSRAGRLTRRIDERQVRS